MRRRDAGVETRSAAKYLSTDVPINRRSDLNRTPSGALIVAEQAFIRFAALYAIQTGIYGICLCLNAEDVHSAYVEPPPKKKTFLFFF